MRFVVIAIIIIFIVIIYVQPIVKQWPLVSFLILYTDGRTLWTGCESDSKPLHINRTHKHRIKAYKYQGLEGVSNQ